MTRQEEIREGINILLHGNRYRLDEHTGQRNTVDKLIAYLHSQGVVIQVERELPEEDCAWLAPASFSKCCPLIEAGYEAVEPLVKE